MSDTIRTAHSAAGMAADYLAEARVAAAAGRPTAFYTARAADLLKQAADALRRIADPPRVAPNPASALLGRVGEPRPVGHNARFPWPNSTGPVGDRP